MLLPCDVSDAELVLLHLEEDGGPVGVAQGQLLVAEVLLLLLHKKD